MTLNATPDNIIPTDTVVPSISTSSPTETSTFTSSRTLAATNTPSPRHTFTVTNTSTATPTFTLTPTPFQKYHLIPLVDGNFWDTEGNLGLVAVEGSIGVSTRELLDIPV